jgi:hypothetical protein
MLNLNDDVFKVIISFLDKNQFQILTEINKSFYQIISSSFHIQKPSVKFLLSSIPLYEWAKNHNFKCKNIFETIIKYNKDNPIHLLDHVYSKNNKKLLTSKVFVAGFKSKNHDILKWLKSHFCAYSITFFYDYDLDENDINWIKEELIWNYLQLYQLMKLKKINFVKWACANQKSLRDFVCEFAVELNDFEMIKWALSKGFKAEPEVFAMATKIGNFDVCNYLLSKNCSVDDEALYYAVESNNLEMVKWCIKNNFPSSPYACAVAVSNNNLEMLIYLREHNVPWDFHTYLEAKHHPLIFKYVIENGCPEN